MRPRPNPPLAGPRLHRAATWDSFKKATASSPPMLEQKTFALPVGDYTEPIAHTARIRHPEGDGASAGRYVPPLSQVEGEVQNAMYQEAIQPALRAYLTRLREEAYIDLRPGFVDSGASSQADQARVFAVVRRHRRPRRSRSQKKRHGRRKGWSTGTDAQHCGRQRSRPCRRRNWISTASRRKAKREKVRFGQAPRTALPEGTWGSRKPTDATGQIVAAGDRL